MRICFFANARDLHAQRLSADLAGRGHDVAVVCHNPVTIRGVGVERFHVPPPGLRHPHRWGTRRLRYLREFLRRFDVVVVFFLHEWGFTPDLMAAGCLVACPCGSDIVTPPGEGPPTAQLVESRKVLLRHAALVGAFGARFAHIIADFAGLAVDEIRPLPLGVDLEQFRPGAAGGARLPTGKRIGFFRGFRAVYGAPDLIRAIPRVLAQCPATRLDFVGEGDDLPLCQRLADELGVDRFITWMPRVRHEEVPGLLSRWHLVAMPSICESFGVAALEASAMCVPVVASDVGGLPDTVSDGKTGLLVPPRSPTALATALVALLKDDERRRRMGEVGRKWVREHHNWKNVLARWETTLQEARDRVSVMV